MVSKKEIYREVKKILIDVFEFEENRLTPNKHLYQDLGLDSLDFIDLSVKFGADIGVKFTEEDLRPIRTISDIVEVVHKKLNAGHFLES
jgi:acyl carrier protein